MFRQRDNGENVFIYLNVARVIQNEYEYESALAGIEEHEVIKMVDIIHPDTQEPFVMLAVPYKTVSEFPTTEWYGTHLCFVVSLAIKNSFEERKKNPPKNPLIIRPTPGMKFDELK